MMEKCRREEMKSKLRAIFLAKTQSAVLDSVIFSLLNRTDAMVQIKSKLRAIFLFKNQSAVLDSVI